MRKGKERKRQTGSELDVDEYAARDGEGESDELGIDGHVELGWWGVFGVEADEDETGNIVSRRCEFCGEEVRGRDEEDERGEEREEHENGLLHGRGPTTISHSSSSSSPSEHFLNPSLPVRLDIHAGRGIHIQSNICTNEAPPQPLHTPLII